MSTFREINPEQFEQGPFKLIGSDWMLITAESGGRVNAMTASWGGLGVMWGRPAAFTVIRPQRFTKGLVDASERLSLCFLPDELRDKASYMGSASGRNEDKIAKSGLTLRHEGGVPYFAEAKLVLFCRKLYAQYMLSECFTAPGIVEKWYPASDYHMLYVSEVEKVWTK